MERTLEKKVIEILKKKRIAVKNVETIKIGDKKMFAVSIDTSVNEVLFKEALEDLSRTKEVDCAIDRKLGELFIIFKEAKKARETTTKTEKSALKEILEKLGIPVIS